MTASHDARFVWAADAPPAGMPVDSVIFRRTFALAERLAAATLHLFASTRYRLRVNGAIVAHGPVRFVPGHEQFDSHDLAPHLRAGENAIVVEARFVDANNFQSMPGDRGRFIAWGDAGGVDLATPGGWTAARCDAWRPDAPAFSFAIGPAEVLDVAAHAACLTGSAFGPPRVLDDVPTLSPRTLPPPTDDWIRPRPDWCAPLAAAGTRASWVSHAHHAEATDGAAFRYATFLHAAKGGWQTLFLHWGPHWLNGVEINGKDSVSRGNCRRFEVQLEPGWNLLCGRPEQKRAATPFLIEAPADVAMRASPKLDDPHALRVLPADTDDWPAPPASGDALDWDDPRWQLLPANDAAPCPARLVAWDRPDVQRHVSAPTLPIDVPAGGWTIVFEFDTEFLGHVEIDVEAPAGTLVDVAYDERLRPDGCVALFKTNPLVETADRFVLPGGRVAVSTFEPRGGRFAQVTIRSPGPATLHGVRCRDVRCLPSFGGDFACDDETLTWAWHRGLRTLRASIEETYCDSPWRERGTYLGDSYVQSLSHLATTADRRTPRASLRLFADGRRDDGQLPCVVPAWLRKPHGDFSLIYAIWLRDWWARTGDLETVVGCLPAAEGVLSSTTWQTSDGGLLWQATEENRLFVDWGADTSARRGRANAVANAFRVRALECVAELRRALGSDDATPFDEEATAVRSAFQERLWRGDQFAMSADSDAPCLHANLLALAFGLASSEQAKPLLKYCIDRLEGNAAKAVRGVPADDFAELYFLKYALDGLARAKRFDIAEQVILDHYGVMRRANVDCLWECLHRGIKGLGSLCHAWSAAATEYLTRHVLGVREATAGEPNRLVVAPNVANIRAASGTFPHPAGPIRVRWTRGGENFTIDATGPDGVELLTYASTQDRDDLQSRPPRGGWGAVTPTLSATGRRLVEKKCPEKDSNLQPAD